MAVLSGTTYGGISNTTVAAVKAVLNLIDGVFTTFGWVKATDTGTLNIAGIAAAPASGADVGWIIYKMNDTLQATSPCFMKVTYGAGAGASQLRMKIQIGTGSDGSGTLTGVLSPTVFTVAQGASDVSFTNHQYYMSGSPSQFAMAFALNGTNWASNHPLFFGVERIHDAVGADTGNGFILVGYFASIAYSLIVSATGSAPLAYAMANCLAPPTGTGASGTNTYLYPIRGWQPCESMPCLNFAAYFNADLTQWNAVSATAWDGVVHTYLPIGLTGGLASASYGGTTVLAMRYE